MVGLLASVGVLAQFMMAPTASAAAAPTRVSVDYAAFLARSDLVWSWDGSGKSPVPVGWWGMGFTGNGLLGAMVTTGNTTSAADDLGTLLIEVGRSDILDDRMPGSEFAVGNGGRCDRVRLPIGYFVLKTEGKVKSGAMRLSLWDAEIFGQLQTTKGAVNFTVLTHALKDLNVAHVVGEAGEAGKVSWQWNPRPGNSVWKQQCQEAAKRHNRNYTLNPPQVNGTKVHGSTTVPYTVQPLLSGASFATAYTTRAEADGSSTLLASTARPMTGARGGGDGTDSAMAAVANVQAGMVLGWNALRQSHRDWWNRFYPASFLSLSDSRTEAFYWAQMYKLASASRASKVAPTYGVYDHTGPWFTPSDTCCPLFNWDMNFPVEYQVVATSNHPEIGYSIHSLLADPVVYLDMAANAGWIETNSTAAVADYVLSAPVALSSYDMIADGGYVGGSASPGYVELPLYQTNLLWALVNVWNLFRATLDVDLLPDLYVLLRGSVNHQLHLAKPAQPYYPADNQTYLHFPETNSPEYPLKAQGGDTNYQLTLTKWGVRTLLQIADLLGVDEPKRDQFEVALKTLAPLPTHWQRGKPCPYRHCPGTGALSAKIGGGLGLKISKDTSFTTSHRHYSHMLACSNAGVLSWDQPKDRQLCLDTIDNWHSGQGGQDNIPRDPAKDMTWEWDGFSYPYSSSVNSRAGRSDAAWGNLTLMLRTVWPKRQLNWQCPHEGRVWPGSHDTGCIGSSMQPNTFQGENGGDGHADPTSETPLSLASAIQDLFVFSDDDSNAVRFFYGMPADMQEASFHHLRGAGALLLSGVRQSGTTKFVRVEALKDGTNCTVFPPPDWGAKTLAAAPSSVQLSAGTVSPSVTFTLDAGEAVLLWPADAPVSEVVIKPAAGESQYFNWWGQHEGGAGRD